MTFAGSGSVQSVGLNGANADSDVIRSFLSVLDRLLQLHAVSRRSLQTPYNSVLPSLSNLSAGKNTFTFKTGSL